VAKPLFGNGGKKGREEVFAECQLVGVSLSRDYVAMEESKTILVFDWTEGKGTLPVRDRFIKRHFNGLEDEVLSFEIMKKVFFKYSLSYLYIT
jgi:hypothetical protein